MILPNTTAYPGLLPFRLPPGALCALPVLQPHSPRHFNPNACVAQTPAESPLAPRPYCAPFSLLEMAVAKPDSIGLL